jgi:hypothetical protein
MEKRAAKFTIPLLFPLNKETNRSGKFYLNKGILRDFPQRNV